MEVSLDSDKVVNSSGSFSQDDLSDKYYNLKSKFANICKLYDASQQEVHDLKRNNQFSGDLKDHLTSEIETLQKNESKLIAECSQKCKYLQDEIDQLKEEKWKDAEIYNSKVEALENKIVHLQQEKDVCSSEKNVPSLDNTKVLEEMRQYEEEISTLKMANMEMKKTLTESLGLNELYKTDVENLKEQIECLQSNLCCKKEELSSLTEMLHSAQEDLCTANMELQQLKSSATTFAAKGNSLFAEVDDKRQEMLKSLSQMKEKVYQLNRELVSKQAEIDSLLCEKKTLWEEYAGQSSHHDAVLSRAYERRITDLEKQSDQLHREIACWFSKHIDPNSSEAAQWLSGVLEHYRKENSRLSGELTAASVNNLSSEQKLRELQKHLVTWRTKAMEARATVSELQTKLQVNEKVVNGTIVAAEPAVNQTVTVSPVKVEAESVKPEANILRESFREININLIPKYDEKRNESIKMLEKENQVLPVQSGILVTGGHENKVHKKTTFK